MKRIILNTAVILSTLIIFSACEKNEAEVLPSTYHLKEASLYPEGIVYSKSMEKTYVGSYFKGKIVTVDLYGNMSDFVIDESLVAVVGIAVDETNNRLLVCNSDAGISMRSDNSTIGQLAQVIFYNLSTGEKQKTINLNGLYPGGNFLNDLVLDPSGNIYVTDSFSPVVYKIDNNGNPSVLVTDSQFVVPQGTFGLNGIVYHPNNYLIVGKSYGGVLYKIPLATPENVQEIQLNQAVNSLDGLLLVDNDLFLVSNNFTGAPFTEAVYKITTPNNWGSGNISGTFTSLNGTYPTTLTMINNGLFVNFGYFTELVDPNSPINERFQLQKINF